MGDENVAKIPFGFLVGSFARSMDERGNMGGKVSEETKVGRIRCENRPDQTPNLYDLSFNSLSLAIFPAILRRLLPFSTVPVFPFSWFSRLGNTLDNTPDRRKVLLVNTKQSGKRTPPTRHVSF